MIVKQFYTSCLSQASYYIESDGEAAVIDPSRDIDNFINISLTNNSIIKYIFQTHFHADFVSGHITLSKKTNAPIVYGPKADPLYECVLANEGDLFSIGNVSLKVIHTPGHTLESCCYLLFDEKKRQHSIFTGDTLFLGDVGIPDVAQRYKGLNKEDLAGILFDSINEKIKPLDDNITVYPGHGAGSACGKNMMNETFDTLKNQKIVNYSLNGDFNKIEFIKELTENLPKPPGYFSANVKMNQDGYEDLEIIIKKSMKKISPTLFKELIKQSNTLVLDTRETHEYIKYHIPYSIFVGLNGRFAPWVGSIVKDINTPIIVVCKSKKELEVFTRLSRIGFDSSIGFINIDKKEDIFPYSEIKSLNSVSPADFVNISEDFSVYDVRSPSEFSNGSYSNAQNIPLNELEDNLNLIKNDSYVYCAGGYRSLIACSLLLRRGKKNITNILDGYSGIKQYCAC